MSLPRSSAATAIGLSLAIGILAALTTSAQALPQGGPFDLAAAENGGRIEWATSQNAPAGAAMNLIATATRHPGWASAANGLDPQEVVFSFFSRQSALVASVRINPMTPDNNDRPKDIEIWTSVQRATTGFVRAAAATLKNEDALQSVEFTAVEAKYVKLRILSAYGPSDTVKPGDFAMAASRVKILEGERTGYVSLLARSPDLAPGAYTVVVTAADQDVRLPVTLTPGQDLTLRALVRGDKLVVER